MMIFGILLMKVINLSICHSDQIQLNGNFIFHFMIINGILFHG